MLGLMYEWIIHLYRTVISTNSITNHQLLSKDTAGKFVQNWNWVLLVYVFGQTEGNKHF